MWQDPITEELALQATLGLGEKDLWSGFLLQHFCVSPGDQVDVYHRPLCWNLAIADSLRIRVAYHRLLWWRGKVLTMRPVFSLAVWGNLPNKRTWIIERSWV